MLAVVNITAFPWIGRNNAALTKSWSIDGMMQYRIPSGIHRTIGRIRPFIGLRNLEGSEFGRV